MNLAHLPATQLLHDNLEKIMSKDNYVLSRRDFLKALTAGTLLIGASGCSNTIETISSTTTGSAPFQTPSATPGVEIAWDLWGVPHVFADSDEDAMFGLGYASAKTRLIQMELSRRIIQGRLAELIGDVPMGGNNESSVASDRYMRNIGFYRHAQKVFPNLNEEEQRFLQAYADGVNKYIVENLSHFTDIIPDLIIQPEPWKPEDCIACWIHVANFFTRDGLNEAKLPNETISAPFDDSAAVVKYEDVNIEWANKVMAFAREHDYNTTQLESNNISGPSFSHAWVVAGSRTTTGAAVLVSDPQTPIALPNLFFEFHIKGETFDTRGVGAAGSPIILIGWNRDVAWGVTALGGDQADLFKLSIDRGHVNQYLWNETWEEMNVWNESIEVKNQDPVSITIKETLLGPVVTQFLRGKIEPGEYVLHRVPQVLKSTDTFRAAIAMTRSKNVEELDRALGDWAYPPINVVFGDSNEDIGYHMTGASPIRAINPNVSSSSFQDGSGSTGEWRGFIPHELQPHVFNPGQGWLASANHRPIESWYPMLQRGTGSSGHTSRSWRLYELLQSQTLLFTSDDVFSVHYDDIDPARRTIVETAVYLADNLGISPTIETASALNFLRPWLSRGAHCSSSDPAYPLVKNISTMFRPNASRSSLARFGGGESGLVLFCKALKEAISINVAIDSDAMVYVDNAIMQSWNTCTKLYGENSDSWSEQFRNSISKRRLEYMVGLDGFPSLNPELWISYPILSDLTTSTIFSQGGQSYTQFVSLDDVDSAMSLMPVGNSEVPISPFFQVNLNAWAKGELHAAPLSKDAVDAYRVETEVIQRTE